MSFMCLKRDFRLVFTKKEGRACRAFGMVPNDFIKGYTWIQISDL